MTAEAKSPVLRCLGKHPSLVNDGEGLPRLQPELDTAAMLTHRAAFSSAHDPEYVPLILSHKSIAVNCCVK